MDELIFGIFTAFVLSLFFIGVFRKQIVLTIFAGVGFMLIGLFMVQGISYQTGAVFTDSSWTVTDMVNQTGTWHSAFAIPICIFLCLFGLALIYMSIMELLAGRRTELDERVGDEDAYEEAA